MAVSRAAPFLGTAPVAGVGRTWVVPGPPSAVVGCSESGSAPPRLGGCDSGFSSSGGVEGIGGFDIAAQERGVGPADQVVGLSHCRRRGEEEKGRAGHHNQDAAESAWGHRTISAMGLHLY